MPHDPDRRRAYDRARASFDELPPRDQARFLLETTVAAAARGARNASRVLADEFENFFRGADAADPEERRRERDEHERRPGRPGAAEPPTAGARRSTREP